MKLQNVKLILAAGISALLVGCSTSESVVSSGLIQKRKYNSGFYIKTKSKGKVDQGETLAKKELKKQAIEEEKTTFVVTETPLNLNNSTDNKTTDVTIKSTENQVVNEVEKQNSTTSVQSVRTTSNSETTPASLVKNAEKPDVKSIKQILKSEKKLLKKESKGSSAADSMLILLIAFCFIFTPIAVIIHTDINWFKVLISFVLWCVFILPGAAYGILVILDIL